MFLKQLNRLQYIDQLIRQKRTGNAEEFAEKLGVSRRQIYYWLEDLKDLGLDISYDRFAQSFIYQKPYKINIAFDIEELTDTETLNTMAGCFFQQHWFLQAI